MTGNALRTLAHASYERVKRRLLEQKAGPAMSDEEYERELRELAAE